MLKFHGQKAQSAMEYITTYGWAFILIIIVVAALVAVGVLYPQSYVRNTCIIEADFSCLTTILSYNGLLQVNIQQSTTSPINITAIGCNANYNTSEMESIVPNAYLPIGANATFVVQCYQNKANWNGTVGSLFNGYLLLNYTSAQYPYPQTVYGTLILKVSVPQITTSTISTSTTSTSSTSTSSSTTSTTSIPQGPTLYVGNMQSQITIGTGSPVTLYLTCFNTYPDGYSDCSVLNYNTGQTVFPQTGQPQQACLSTCDVTLSPTSNTVYYAKDLNYTTFPEQTQPVTVNVVILQPTVTFSSNPVLAGYSVTITATCNYDQPCNLESPEGDVIGTGAGSYITTINALQTTTYWANDLTYDLQASNTLTVQVVQPSVTFSANPIVAGSNSVVTATCNYNQPCNLESPAGNVVCSGLGSCSSTQTPPSNTVYYANDLTYHLMASNTLIVQIKQPYVTFGTNPLYYGYSTTANAVCSPGSTCELQSPLGTALCGPQTTMCSNTVSPLVTTTYYANDLTNHIQNSLVLTVLRILPVVNFTIGTIYIPSGYPTNTIGFGWIQTNNAICTPSTDGCTLELGTNTLCSGSGSCSNRPSNPLSCSASQCFYTYNAFDSVNGEEGQNTIEVAKAAPQLSINVPSQDQPPGYPSNTIYYGYGANIVATCNPQADNIYFYCAIDSQQLNPLDEVSNPYSTGPITSNAPWPFYANDTKTGVHTENVLNVVEVAPVVTMSPSNIIDYGSSASVTATCTPSQDPCTLKQGSTTECTGTGSCTYNTPTSLVPGYYTFNGLDTLNNLQGNNILRVITPPVLLMSPGNAVTLGSTVTLTASCMPSSDNCAVYYGTTQECNAIGSCSYQLPSSFTSSSNTYTFSASDLTSILSTTNTLDVLPIPYGILYYENITLQNTAKYSTANGLQIGITLALSPDVLWGSTNVAANLQNIEFFYTKNGTVITSWLEGVNQSEYTATDLSSYPDLLYWIKYGPSIHGSSTAVNAIAIGFASTSTNLFNGKTVGVAPQLFCSPGCPETYYGQYDNGWNEFNFYDNFSGTTLNTTKWDQLTSGTVTVSNGITFKHPSGNWDGLETNIEFSTDLAGNPSTMDFLGEPPFPSGSNYGGIAIGFAVANEQCSGPNALLGKDSNIGGNLDFDTCTLAAYNQPQELGVWTISADYDADNGIAYFNYGNEFTEPLAGEGFVPIEFAYQYNAKISGSVGIQWFRVRITPPTGIMPSYTLYPTLQTVP